MNKREDKLTFNTTIHKFGGSLGIIFPQRLMEKLKLKKGNKAKLMLDKGKHGFFIAIWNPKQQKKKKKEKK